MNHIICKHLACMIAFIFLVNMLSALGEQDAYQPNSGTIGSSFSFSASTIVFVSSIYETKMVSAVNPNRNMGNE